MAGKTRKVVAAEKGGLHPRNRHRARYDFATLMRESPLLARFIRPTPYGDDSIDFADPEAVLALNRALLKHDYGISSWDIPPGYLCPPVPGRADYVHHMADLLAAGNGGVVPRGDSVVVLDIGVGANCIYPIIGRAEYGWRFVGTDIDPAALSSAKKIVAANPSLAGSVECRLQPRPDRVFDAIIKPGETFALCICNPPFHSSAAEANAGTRRKLRNLSGGKKAPEAVLNFGGQNTELWCRGGEVAFLQQMIAESAERPELCGWFTSLVSTRDHLPAIERFLRAVNVAEVRILELAHGQKQSRIVAWTFRR